MLKYKALPVSPPGAFRELPRETQVSQARSRSISADFFSRKHFIDHTKLLSSPSKWKVIIDAQMIEAPSPLRLLLLLHSPHMFEILYLHQLAQGPITHLLGEFKPYNHVGGYFSEEFFKQLRGVLTTAYYTGSLTPILGMTDTTVKDFYLRIPYCDNCKSCMEYSQCSELTFFCLTCGICHNYTYPFLSTGLRYSL